MESNSQLPQSAADWAALYNGLEVQARVPHATDAGISAVNATFRAMYLNLQDVRSQLDAAGVTPPVVTLYADVLTVPDHFTWVLNGAALVVQARRVEVGAQAAVVLDFRQTSTASFVFFAAEGSGTWTVQAVVAGQPQPSTFALTAPLASAGVHIGLDPQAGKPAQQPLTYAQGLPAELPEALPLALTNAFLFGSLLYDQNPPLALGIMTWVKNWAAEADELSGLFWRSTSLATLLTSQLNAQANGATFVPYLTASVYGQLAEAFVDEARQYESDYMALNTQSVLTAENIEQAKALRDNAQYQSAYVQGLKQQAGTNYQNAQAAVDKALQNFRAQQLKAQSIGINFENIGLPEYERKAIAEAIFELAGAVVVFAGAIALMAVGQEEAAPAAAGAAVATADSVAAAATTASTIAKLAKELSEVMKTLKKLVEGLQKVYELSMAIVKAASDIQGAQGSVKQLQDMDLDAEGADLSAADAWQIFSLHVHGVMAEPIAKGIGYAQDYQDALDVLVIYGQSLSSAQLAAVQAGQEYARVLLQEQLAAQQQARLDAYVNSLTAGQSITAAVMQQFYQRYLDAKESLLAALQNYRASYFYWAMAASQVRPQVIDPVNNLETGLQSLTAMKLDQAAALEHFNPAPETMSNKQVDITDPDFLAALRQQKPATWAMPADEADFLGLNRVRITAVRAWLEGARPQGQQKISLSIRTSGSYRDQLDGSGYQFTSAPLKRPFEYHVEAPASHQPNPDWQFADGTLGFIELDGNVDREVQYAYFQPTPFTEWTIQVNPAPANAGLDLSQVSKVTLQFEGSAIGTVVLRRAQQAAPAALAAEASA
ncbi:hypothetical protein [Hymenobacter jeollabukensis]|uniref:Uncharacterized protein n=1 Tax=Hymenobacter jeollabukensis TaxID=2025313 RepID=A0A5R8WRW5_9BACT|nr:hypothetical protein [Hymenobacter jeollabukensis]TLM93921.1 hypothetical protein FDY95_07765 [Hymenobacter jeollabukensis]